MAKTYLDYTVEVWKQLKGRPEGIKAIDYMATLGWTPEEVAALKKAPRVGKVESRNKWPLINGVSTYPWSWMLNEEEAADLKAITKKYNSSGHSTRTTTTGPSFSTEQKEVIESIRKVVDTLPAELQEKFAAAFPTEQELKLKALEEQEAAIKAQMEALKKEMSK